MQRRMNRRMEKKMRERAEPATPNPSQSGSTGRDEPETGPGVIAVGQELAAAFREVFGDWRLEGEEIVARTLPGGRIPG